MGLKHVKQQKKGTRRLYIRWFWIDCCSTIRRLSGKEKEIG
jgi:hypothetical protein